MCSSSSSFVLVDSCLFYGVQYSGGYGFASVSSGILSVFTNCNVFGNGVEEGFTVLTSGTPITAYFYNCNSVNNGSYGFYCSDYRSIVCKNCYSGGNGTADYYKSTNGTFTLTTCRSEDGTLSTTQAAFSTSSGCYFTNVTAGSENLHIGASSELIGAATNLYNDATWSFQTDIDGDDRGGAAAAWDIGADEYVAAATIEQEGFRFRNDDGSESAATWKDSQDVNITLAANTSTRLRAILNATGDPASIGAQLEYRYKPSGGAFGSWTKVN
jgi:hypothetical protein